MNISDSIKNAFFERFLVSGGNLKKAVRQLEIDYPEEKTPSLSNVYRYRKTKAWKTDLKAFLANDLEFARHIPISRTTTRLKALTSMATVLSGRINHQEDDKKLAYLCDTLRKVLADARAEADKIPVLKPEKKESDSWEEILSEVPDDFAINEVSLFEESHEEPPSREELGIEIKEEGLEVLQ